MREQEAKLNMKAKASDCEQQYETFDRNGDTIKWYVYLFFITHNDGKTRTSADIATLL